MNLRTRKIPGNPGVGIKSQGRNRPKPRLLCPLPPLLLLLLLTLSAHPVAGISPYRTAEQIEGFGLFDHGFGFGHLVTGPGFQYSADGTVNAGGHLGPADLAASGCRVPRSRLMAAASPPPFDQSLAGSGYSANSINRGNCRLPKNFFTTTAGRPRRGGRANQVAWRRRRPKLSLTDASAVLPEDLRRIIDPKTLADIALEASGGPEEEEEEEDVANNPGGPKFHAADKDPLFSNGKNYHLFEAAFSQADMEKASPVPLTSPKLRPAKPALDLGKLLQFHWSAVAKVLGLPPGSLDENMFRTALKELRKGDKKKGRKSSNRGIDRLLNLPPGSLTDLLHSADPKVRSAHAKYQASSTFPGISRPAPMSELKKQTAAKFPSIDISKLDPKEAFHWIFSAGRKPPLIFDRIVENLPSYHFQTVQEPMRVFPVDHDEDALLPDEHHFVQFNPTFPYFKSPTEPGSTPPKSSLDEGDKIKSLEEAAASADAGPDSQEKDDRTDGNGPPRQPRRPIPYPYSKWDQPTVPGLLGVVGLAGAGLLICILLCLSVFVAWLWDFEMPAPPEEEEPCPVMSEELCEGGKMADAPTVTECLTGKFGKRKSKSIKISFVDVKF